MNKTRLWLLGLLLFLTSEAAVAAGWPALLAQCAPTVHPATMAALIRTESGGNPYALADAGPAGLPWRVRQHLVKSFYPATKAAAASRIHQLIGEGHIVAIGLTQVSSRNLARLGLSVEDVLEPCANLRAGSEILTAFYLSARRQRRDPGQALVAAISAYNTGSFINGISNGYVRRVLLHAGGAAVPALAALPRRRPPTLLDAEFSAIDVNPQ